MGNARQIAVGNSVAQSRAGRSGDRAADYHVGRPPDLEQADVKAMRARGVAGRHRHRLPGGEIAHRGEVKDVAKHAARDDASSAGRVGTERQSMELIPRNQPRDQASG